MKNASPINSLNAKLERYQSELARTQKTLKDLQEDHSKLIKDWVKIENDNVELKESVESMCEGCIEKNTDSCQSCPMHGIAIKFDLWR